MSQQWLVSDSWAVLTPYVTVPPHWYWYAAKVAALKPCAPVFRIARGDYYYGFNAGYQYAVWATEMDSDNWHLFDNFTIGATHLEFSNDAPLTGTAIYVARYPAVPVSRITRLVGEYLASPYATDTASSTSGVLGYTTERVSPVDGRTVPALPVHAFMIHDGAGARNRVVLVCGDHVGEMMADWTLHGAVSFLLSADAVAVNLRAYCDFYVYPCTNPGGRWNGLSLHSPEDMSANHNRSYHTTGTLETVDLIKAALLADTGADVQAAFDCHGFGNSPNSGRNHAVGVAAFGQNTAWETALQTYAATFNLIDSVPTEGTARWFFHEALDDGTLTIAATPEGSDHPSDFGATAWSAFGANAMRALNDVVNARLLPIGPP